MKSQYYALRTYWNIFSRDLRDKFPLPLVKKLKMWRAGFLAEKYYLYKLDKNNYKDYFSDYHASMARGINEPFNELLTNKLVFAEIVGQAVRVPQTYGWIFNGIYYAKAVSSFGEIVEKYSKFIIKAVNGGGGKDVFIIEQKSNKTYDLNKVRNLNRDELVSFITDLDNFIITEYIQQGNYSKNLNPETVNTIRVLTLIDPDTNQAFIARAVQRIGVKKSAPMDNFTKGGLSASINLETGKLGDATLHPKVAKHLRYSTHPDTNIKFEGLTIPNWSEVKVEILHAAESLPMLKCIGWDFVLTDSTVVAIEGNHHPDPDVLQCHSPLLIDEKIKNFYKYHKII